MILGRIFKKNGIIEVFNWLRLIVIIFTTIYFLGCSSYQEEKLESTFAPDFTLNTIEGDEIHLKDYPGEMLVHLVFWSTRCPKCLVEMDRLKKLWDTMGTRPYKILAINVGLSESQKRIKEIQKQYQIPFKIVLDKNAKVTKDFGVISIPYHIIIDKEGVIIDRFFELPEEPVSFMNKLFAGKKTG